MYYNTNTILEKVNTAPIKVKKSYLTDIGTVTHVFERNALLDLEKSGDKGSLHIAHFKDELIDGGLFSCVKVGDVLPVAIGKFDKDHQTWDVSHKAYDLACQFEAAGLHNGMVADAVVLDSSEFECTLSFEGFAAKMLAPKNDTNTWTRYRVFYKAKLFEPGMTVKVIVKALRAITNVFKVDFYGPYVEADAKTTHMAKVIYVRSGHQKQKNKFHSTLFTMVGNVLAKIEVSDILDAATAFPIGSFVPICMRDMDIYSGTVTSCMVWEETRFSNPKLLRNGDVCEGIVIWTAPYGVICLVEDRVTCFIHKLSITKSGENEVNKILRPGDIIKVIIKGWQAVRKTYTGDFVRVVEAFEAS